jgi:hypothetical protein
MESATRATAPVARQEDTVISARPTVHSDAPRARAPIERAHREDTHPDNVIDLTGETA